MARRIVHIEPTPEQWETIDQHFGGSSVFIAIEDPDELMIELVVPGSPAQTFRVSSDGTYTEHLR